MKNIQIDIIIILSVLIIWITIAILMQNKVCADWQKTCLTSPIPSIDMIVDPTPSLSCTPTLTPVISQIITPTAVPVQTNTPIPRPTAISTPIAGQSAAIIMPTQAPDTGRAQ